MNEWRPLKRFCSIASEYGINVNAAHYEIDGTRLIRTSDINADGSLKGEDSAVYIDPTTARGLLLEPGDLLFSRSGTLGRCLRFVGERGTCTFAAYLVRFRVTPDCDSRFVAYCARAGFFSDQIAADSIQSTISNFNGEKYGNIRLPWHKSATQGAIADYLDTETAAIDTLIGNTADTQTGGLGRLAKLLAERRQTLITAAVMGELDIPGDLT